MAAPVFISHSVKNQKVAATLCGALERRGFSCWMGHRDVGPGENFQEAIVQAITSAKVMVLVFSAHANNSSEIKKELALAGQYELVVIPVRVEDVTPSGAFRYELATRQWIDMFDDWERAIEKLTTRMTAILSIDNHGATAAGSAAQAAAALPPARTATFSMRVLLGAAAAVLLVFGIAGAVVYGLWPTQPPKTPPSARIEETRVPVKRTEATLPAGALRRITLHTVISGKTITAVLARVSGDHWVWSERGTDYEFKLMSESPTELLFHDVSRDMYHRVDLKLRLNFWRPGISTTWYTHYNVISVE